MTEMVNVTIVGLQLAPDTAASVVLLGESAAPDRVLIEARRKFRVSLYVLKP